MLDRFRRTHEFRLLVAAAALAALLAVLAPRFLSVQNLLDLVTGNAFVGILAAGLLVVLVAGSIDISFTATASVAQYISLSLAVHHGLGALPTIAIACGAGVLLGMSNAVLVQFLRMSGIIVSIATLNVYFGLLMFVSKGQQIYNLPEWFSDALSYVIGTSAQGDPYILNAQIICLVAVFAVTAVLLNMTGVGRQLRALGGNPEAAKRVGFRPFALNLVAFGYLGLTAGIASLVQAQLAQSVAPNVLVGRELSVLAAVVLGGATLTGGHGTVLGTILGLAILAMLENGLILLGVSSYWTQCFTGLVIVVGVAAIGLERRRARGGLRRRRTVPA